MPNEAVLYCTHIFNSLIDLERDRLRAELPDLSHWVIGFLKDEVPSPAQPSPDQRMYRRRELSELPYPRKIASINWIHTSPSNDLPALAFYREKPDYDFYWLIEYDVRYTGSWRDLFAELSTSKADLLATTVQDYEENPEWDWWPSLVDVPNRPLQLMRAFLPFCRLSNRALAAIDRWYRESGSGHYELVWPGVCKSADLKIEDIGGRGRYTRPEWRGKHYFNSPQSPSLWPGTFIFRPAFKHALIEGHGLKHAGRPMLWHPIKS